LLLAGCLVAFAPADGFKERFIALYKAGKKAEAEQVLREWEQQQPNDPELYIIRFNLLEQQAAEAKKRAGSGLRVMYEKDFAKAIQSGQLAKQQKAEKTSQQQAEALLLQATATLRKGIALAPDRLDMRFGLAKTYEEWNQPAAEVQVLREALADHAQRQQPWRWREGAPLPQPESEMLPHSLEGYANHYWQPQEAVFPQQMQGRDEDQAKEYGKQLAELLITHYPASSLGPFNLGVYHLLKEQWAAAEIELKKADVLQPNDSFTVYNLTRAAVQQKHKQDATAYLARLRQLPGTEEQVTECEQDIKKLP
jgi:Tfp pilus assembly protein PilF